MDWGWASQLIPLLFNHLGAVGTVVTVFLGVVFWLLHKEQEAHDKTRDRLDEINEKRLNLAVTTLETLKDLRNSVDALGMEIKEGRGKRKRSVTPVGGSSSVES